MEISQNKIVLITGSSSGIGAAVARRFAQFNYNVVITGRNTDKLSGVASDCEENKGCVVLCLAGDITEDEHRQILVQTTLETFGKLDILVNSVGISCLGVIDQSLDEFDLVMKTNIRATYAITQLCVPHIISTKGNIVNVSSAHGQRPSGRMLVCSMVKAAMDAFTQGLALELGPKGVMVNSVNPGTIRTHIIEQMVGPEGTEKYYKERSKQHPLGRVGAASEVADVVAFLTSDWASFISDDLVFVAGARQCVSE